MKKLAIAIPTYNEKDNIVELVEKIKIIVKSLPIDTTIIIIDDNSPDGTGKIADNLSHKYTHKSFSVSVIHRKGKLGLASAYIEAFSLALKNKFDYILSMDADLSHNPKYIPVFIKKSKDYDLIIGSRNIQGGKVENWSFIRNIMSKGGSLYARTILNVPIKDFTGGYNLFSQKALRSIDIKSIKSEGYSFQIEMKYRIVKKRLRFCEIPIIFPDRKRGKAKMNKNIFIEAIFRVWQIKFSK
jgi:dolichol-phosphate mannosyltransferase